MSQKCLSSLLPKNSEGFEHLQIHVQSTSLANRPNILLVEDEPCIQMIHSMYLQKAEYNFHLAATGIDAISAFNAQHFDLVLLDIRLPDMSGIDVCKAIRSSRLGKTIPIIAWTCLGKAIERECLEAGIDSILEKPISYNHFLNFLQTALDTTKGLTKRKAVPQQPS